MTITIPSHLTNDELTASLPDLAGDERHVTARLVAHLAELDRRQLFIPAGYSSLYYYCRDALGYSEDAAYNRKVAATVARRHPAILDMLADGRLGLTTVKLLAPVLSDSNCDAMLKEAAGGSKREVEELVARVNPKPDVPSTVRRLATPKLASAPAADGPGDAAPDAAGQGGTAAEPCPERGVAEATGEDAVPEPPGEDAAASANHPSQERPADQPGPRFAAAKRPEVKPLAPERYRVQFTIGAETEKKLRRLQTLLKREIPDGDPAVLFDRGLDLLLAGVERRKQGKTHRRSSANASEAADAPVRRPKPGSRHMPARTRREVSVRDEDRCAFVGPDGRRCTERAFLEYHHGPVPYAHGGPPTTGNVSLHCRAHNAYEGRRLFGAYLPREIREARILDDATRFAVPERR